MSLQGTLDTFALPDVLRLLASTAKTGYLRLDGSRGSGGLWFDAGRVAAAAPPRPDRPAPPVAPGAEALFELLRAGDGSFVFEAGTASPIEGPTGDVASLLGEAEVLLEEWREVEAVVPSLACSVALRPDLDAPSVSISADRWRSLVAVAGGSDVEDVRAALGLGELSASRTVKELVEAGLVDVGPAPVVLPAVVVDAEPEVEVEVEPQGEVEVEAEAEAEVDVARAAEGDGAAATVLDVLHELADGGADDEPPAGDADGPAVPGPIPALDGAEGAPDTGDLAAAGSEDPVVAPRIPQAPRPVVRPPGSAPAFRLPAPPQPVTPVEGFLRRPPVARPGSARPAQDGRLSNSLGELAAIADRGRQAPPAPPAAGDDDTHAVAQRLSELGPDAAAKVAAAAQADTPEERDAALDAIEAATDGQPVNRGALLKFLSSVRT